MAKSKKPEDQSSENEENFSDSSDDTFGLPEIEYEPLKREEETVEEKKEEVEEEVYQTEEEPQAEQSSYQQEEQHHNYEYSYQQEESSSPVWPKALMIVAIIVILVGGGLWLFLKYLPEKEEAERRAALELAARAAKEKREAAVRDSITRIEDAERRRIADSIAQATAVPPAGTIEQLSERTRRYYVVVASAVDDDLILDHAQQLSKTGVSCWVIPPFGKAKFYRLAIASGDSFGEAQSKADELKGTYGDAVWVLRY